MRGERLAPGLELRPAADQFRRQGRGQCDRRGRRGARQRRQAAARFLRGRRAARGVLFQQREDQLIEQRRDAGNQVARRGRRQREVRAHDLPGIGAEERVLPGHDAVQHAAQRVEVGAPIGCGAAQRFRRERGGGAAQHARLGPSDAGGQPEIDQRDGRGIGSGIVADEDVRGLDVAVDEAASVQRAERVEQRVGDARDRRRVRALQGRVDRAPRHEVHREPGGLGAAGAAVAVRRLDHAVLVDRHEVRVAQGGEDVELAVEGAGQLGRVGDPLRTEQLQREDPAAVPVPDPQHLARGAGTEPAQDLEPAGQEGGSGHGVVMRHSVAGRNTRPPPPFTPGHPPGGRGKARKTPEDKKIGPPRRAELVEEKESVNKSRAIAVPPAMREPTDTRGTAWGPRPFGIHPASVTRRVSLTGEA